jgi:hypothetical protein
LSEQTGQQLSDLEKTIWHSFFVANMDAVAIKKALEQYLDACVDASQKTPPAWPAILDSAADLNLLVYRIIGVLRRNLESMRDGLLQVANEVKHVEGLGAVNIPLDEVHVHPAHKSE